MATLTVDQIQVIIEANYQRFRRDNEAARVEFERAMGGMYRSAISTEAMVGRAMTGIGTALAAIGLSSGISSVTQYADAWTNAANRISAAGVPVSDIARRQADLVEVAKRSRTEFGAVVELYSRLSMGATELGASQEQIIRATETVSKLLSLSGASASEASGAIIQFSQGLASGTLRGEELNSVLEQAPPLARIIAREFGISVGELRKLGEQGQLAAARILKALLGASADVDKQFARTKAAVSGAITNLRTALTQYIGGLDQASGASGILADLIQGLASNFEDVGKSAVIAGAAIAAAFAPAAIEGSIKGLAGIARLVASNPWIALAAAVGAATAAVIEFGDQIHPVEGEVASLADYAMVAWTELKSGAISLGQSMVDRFVSLVSMITQAIGGVPVSLEDIGSFIVRFINFTIGNFVALYNTVKTVFSGIGPAIADGVVTAANSMIDIIQRAINTVIEDFNTYIRNLNSAAATVDLGPLFGEIAPVSLAPFQSEFQGAGAKLGDALGQGIRDAYKPYIQNFLGDWTAAANQLARDRVRRDKDTLAPGEGGPPPPPPVTGEGLRSPPAATTKTKVDAYKKEIDQTRRRTAELQIESEAVGLSAAEIARRQKALELEQAAEKAGLPVTAERRREIDALAEAYGRQVGTLDYARDLKGIRDRIAAIRDEIEMAGLSGAAARERAIAIELENAAERAGIELTAARRQEIAALASEYVRTEDARSAAEGLREAWNDVGHEAASALGSIINGSDGAAEAATRMANALAEAAVQAALLGEGPLAKLFGTSGSGGLFGIAGSLIGGLLGGNSHGTIATSLGVSSGPVRGHLAKGGPVRVGATYLVGERGPELFTPDAGGRIVPEIPDVSAINRTVDRVQAQPQRIETHFRQTIDLRGANGEETIARIARAEAQKGAAMAIKTSDQKFVARLSKRQRYGR